MSENIKVVVCLLAASLPPASLLRQPIKGCVSLSDLQRAPSPTTAVKTTRCHWFCQSQCPQQTVRCFLIGQIPHE